MLQLYGPATTDPAGEAFSDGRACTMVHVSARNRRIHLVSHRKRYFVMQPGLQLLLFTHVYVHIGLWGKVGLPGKWPSTTESQTLVRNSHVLHRSVQIADRRASTGRRGGASGRWHACQQLRYNSLSFASATASRVYGLAMSNVRLVTSSVCIGRLTWRLVSFVEHEITF